MQSFPRKDCKSELCFEQSSCRASDTRFWLCSLSELSSAATQSSALPLCRARLCRFAELSSALYQSLGYTIFALPCAELGAELSSAAVQSSALISAELSSAVVQGSALISAELSSAANHSSALLLVTDGLCMIYRMARRAKLCHAECKVQQFRLRMTAYIENCW